MTRTNCAIGLMNQDTVGADGLVAMMFDHVWCAREFCEKHGGERGTGDVDDVGGADEAPEFEEGRVANDGEWQCSIVEGGGERLGSDGNVQFFGDARNFGGVGQFAGQ